MSETEQPEPDAEPTPEEPAAGASTTEASTTGASTTAAPDAPAAETPETEAAETEAPAPETATPAASESTTPAPAPVRDPADELRSRLRFAHILNAVLGAGIAALLVTVIVLALRPPVATAPSSAPESAPTSAAESPAEEAPRVPDLSRRDPADPLAIGAVDAPVVIVEWLDYRCPYCAQFTNETMPTIVAEYVEAGLVRWEFNDVVFFGDDSLAAAIAARAAAAQGLYHEYLAVLFAAAPTSGHPDLPRETLIAFAEQAGVPDLDAFVAALDDPEILAAVMASHERAVGMGVQSVPTFVIGQTVLQGAYPLDTFRQALDTELAAAQG